MTDQNMTLMGHQRHDWMILLNTTIVATLIMQYFCTNEQGDHTLPELFAQVPFHYSLASDEEELGTYKELTTDYQRFRRITPTQHLELISILEKRLSRGGAFNLITSSRRSRTTFHLRRGIWQWCASLLLWLPLETQFAWAGATATLTLYTLFRVTQCLLP